MSPKCHEPALPALHVYVTGTFYGATSWTGFWIKFEGSVVYAP